MMKKTIAALLEAVHLLATAFLFAAGFWTARMTAPVIKSKLAGVANANSARVAGGIGDVLVDRGMLIAGLALAALAGAGVLRGDLKKPFGLVRLAAAVGALLFTAWAYNDLPDDKLYRAWNCLFVATGINLLATGFLVGGGKGGAPKAAPAK
jgi:hypothetical protein